VVDVVIVLFRTNAHVIARLKIADLRGTAGSAGVFSRIRDRDGGDRLVVGLNDDILLPDVPQYPGERGRVGLAALALALRRTALLTLTRISTRIAAPARISATWISATWIPATWISDAGNDLAKTGNAGQQENNR
jgi:hypothetical protein